MVFLNESVSKTSKSTRISGAGNGIVFGREVRNVPTARGRMHLPWIRLVNADLQFVYSVEGLDSINCASRWTSSDAYQLRSISETFYDDVRTDTLFNEASNLLQQLGS